MQKLILVALTIISLFLFHSEVKGQIIIKTPFLQKESPIYISFGGDTTETKNLMVTSDTASNSNRRRITITSKDVIYVEIILFNLGMCEIFNYRKGFQFNGKYFSLNIGKEFLFSKTELGKDSLTIALSLEKGDSFFFEENQLSSINIMID